MRLTPVLLLIILCSFATSEVRAADSWVEAMPGLERLDGVTQNSNLKVRAIRVTSEDFQPRIVRAASFGRKVVSMPRFVKESGALACLNANFFDEAQEPLGLVVSGGSTYHNLQLGGTLLTGIFYATRTSLGIVHRGAIELPPVLEAAQAGPRLITDGKKNSGINEIEKSLRSVVCLDNQKKMELITIAEQITLAAVQDVVLEKPFECREALNFDGGSSSDIAFGARVQGDTPLETSETSPQVPVALCIFIKKK